MKVINLLMRSTGSARGSSEEGENTVGWRSLGKGVVLGAEPSTQQIFDNPSLKAIDEPTCLDSGDTQPGLNPNFTICVVLDKLHNLPALDVSHFQNEANKWKLSTGFPVRIK